MNHAADPLPAAQRAVRSLAAEGGLNLLLGLVLAALLIAAVAALSAPQRVDAQARLFNGMETGDDADRTNFRMELSLIDDSDNIVPAGSSLRVKAVIKFDVESGKTNGAGPADHGKFGSQFHLQAGSTLRIAGQFEWENAAGRTLRIDPDRMGASIDEDPGERGISGTQHADCGAADDFNNDNGRIIWDPANMNQNGVACPSEPTSANGRILAPRADDWKYLAYSRQGVIGNGYDLLPERDGVQGPCTPSTTDDLTTWTCEITLVDEQFGWRGHSSYASLNGRLTASSVPNWNNFALTPQRAPNDRDASITIPDGTADGSFTISGSIALHSALGRVPAQAATNADKITLSDSLEVTVGTVAEAHSAKFGFATQTATDMPADGLAGEPWPNRVSATDGETKLRLQILNEGGKPSARNSLSSIVMRTNVGKLTSNIPDGTGASGDGCLGAGALTCQIVVSNLDTTNSGNIVFTLASPTDNKAGTAQVTGSVVDARGDVLSIDTLTVIFTGVADAITLSGPSTSILNTATSATDDNRNRLTLSISATDASDQPATVPERGRGADLRDPDGKKITQSDSTIQVAWPLMTGEGDDAREAKDAAGNLQTRITVHAAAERALTPGEYTLEVRAGGLEATQTFVVSGDAESIEVEASAGEFGQSDQFTLTATVTNADGAPVPDGTPVSFTGGPPHEPKLVQLNADAGTKSGRASVTYVIIAAGQAWVSVKSGNGGDFWTRQVGVVEMPAGADALSGRAGLVTYLGDAEVQASALLPTLDNVTALRLYRADAWLFYGVADGRTLPGSTDFTITRGAVLWLSN